MRDDTDWDRTRTGIGALSIWLGTGALVAPRAITRLLGVPASAAYGDQALPLLVRLAAARNIAMGAALLAAPPSRRTSEVALLLAGIDAAAVLSSRHTGDLARRSPVLSLTVLGAAVAAVVRWHQD